jgi:hypothetical protein
VQWELGLVKGASVWPHLTGFDESVQGQVHSLYLQHMQLYRLDQCHLTWSKYFMWAFAKGTLCIGNAYRIQLQHHRTHPCVQLSLQTFERKQLCIIEGSSVLSPAQPAEACYFPCLPLSEQYSPSHCMEAIAAASSRQYM